MPELPKFSGQYTKAGRPVWIDPDGNKYSEKTVTIPLSVDKDGAPIKGTKWVNVPSVFDRGQIIDDEDFLAKFYKENGYKDPLTKKRLQIFDSLDSAVDAAKKRSDSLLD